MKTTLTLLFTVALALSGCAFNDGEGKTSVEGKVAEDLRQARADISPIIGQWVGVLNRGGTALEVEMSIQEDLIQTGRTADGQPIFRVDPRATFTSVDGRYNQTFSGTYLKSTGELILSTNQTPVQLDQIQTLSLNLRGSTLSGAVRTPSSYLGEVTLTLQGRQNDGSQRDNEEVRAERLRQIYAPLVGSWIGLVKNTRGEPREFRISLAVYIDEQPTPSGRTSPVLRATYDRPDSPEGILRRNLSITYAYANNPPGIFMTSVNPNGYSVSLSGRFAENADGSLDPNHIIGNHTNVTLGNTGTMEIRKVGSTSNAPAPGGSQIPVPTPRPRP
ncbi:MAG: hypothetical protein KF789_08355 [Bdellovibrionaceae bacterium]|nr:hypothetical protein [Pseudobdellovibrionaceae bacterium]